MREATHRLLYMVAHSNAMNGLAEGVRIIDVTPTWIILLNTLEIVMIVLSVLAIAGLVVSIVFLRLDNN
jgi:beta-glucosidase